MSKIIERILAHPKVASISDERGMGDGFWVYLKKGWQNDPETHCIHENSPTRCFWYLPSVSECSCDDCMREGVK